MSRIGKAPIPVPAGVDVTDRRPGTSRSRAPRAQLARELPDAHHRSRQDGDDAPGGAPRRRAREPCAARSDPLAGHQHGHRRHRRASARSSRSSASATAPPAKGPTPSSWRSASRHPVNVNAPEGITFEVPQPTRIDVHGIDKELVGQVAADIRKHPQARALQGQGRPLRRRARPPQGRQGRRSEAIAVSDKSKQKRGRPQAPSPHGSARRSAAPPSVRAWPCSGPTAHQRPGHRRPWPAATLAAASHASSRTCAPVPTANVRRGRQGRPAASPSGPRPPASTRSCSTAAASSTTAAWRRSPRPPAKPDWSSDGTEQGQLGPAAA